MAVTQAGAPQAPVLHVNMESPVPPYEQLREQIAGLIAVGELAPGARLPPVRQLAADLGLAGGTIARAYRELEQAALIEGRGRHGTVVCAPQATAGPAADGGLQALMSAADQLALTARAFGFSEAAAIAAARTALSRQPTQGAGNGLGSPPVTRSRARRKPG